MTDFDADEPVAPPQIKTRSSLIGSDRLIAGIGIALAVTAAFFPWYVFFNEDKFAINISSLATTKEMPNWAGRAVVNAPPSAIGAKTIKQGEPKPADDIVTGTVPDGKKPDDAGDPEADAQPFPSTPVEFRLLHVAQGRGMISDKTGIYVVGVGSSLPDLSKVANFEERDGQWVIITDKGDVYDANGRKQ